MKLRILPSTFLPVLLAAWASAQTSLPQMHLSQQSLDGNAADIVGPSEATQPLTEPFLERVWGAQGRRRAAWRISDRERLFVEEDKDFHTELRVLAIDQEGLPEADRLFTLTARKEHQHEASQTVLPAVIKVTNIEFPNAPAVVQEFVFLDSESPRFICTDPLRNKLIVLVSVQVPGPLPHTIEELRIYDYDNPPLYTLDTTPMGGAMLPTGMTLCNQTLSALNHAQIEDIGPAGAQERTALIAATVEDPLCGKDQQPFALIACNIENAVNPFFHDVDLTTQAWHPCRPTTPLEPCSEWRFNGYTHVRVAGRDLVYAVGGADIGLTELDVTDVADPTKGIVEKMMYPINGNDLLFRVEADPEAPIASDFLYIVGRLMVYVVDRASLGTSPVKIQTPVAFGNGPAGAQLVLGEPEGPGGTGPKRRDIWTLAKQHASYIFRVTDFTQDGIGPLDAPDASERYFGAAPTDGAVAHFGWDSVYTANFGGVVRWDISGAEPVPVVDHYQPAIHPISGANYTVEGIELVDMGQPGFPDMRLLAPTARGHFFAWPLNPSTHDPLPGTSFQPSDHFGYWGIPINVGYGNDLVTATNPTTGDKWVFIDYSDSATPTGTFRIGRYNWTDNTWPGSPIVWNDPLDLLYPNCRDLAIDEDRWILVAGNGGFLVIDALAGPVAPVKDYVYTNDVEGLSFARVMGIEKRGNRIFASLADPENRFAFAMYDFDPLTGHVIDPATGLQGDGPLQVLFDGQPTKPNDFPGVYLDGGNRISALQISASPKKLRLYSGSGRGNVVEVEWDESTDTMTALSYWHNGGYFDQITDCNAYMFSDPLGGAGFGPEPEFHVRVVISKAMETFEIVVPPGFD